VKPVFDEALVSFLAPGPWAELGACKGADPNLFFGHARPTLLDKAERDLLCASCPVLTECRAYALQWPDLHGFWGGMSEQDRRAARANWRREQKVAS
jgi:WhiB family redox-sensing transcriptional regulator